MTFEMTSFPQSAMSETMTTVGSQMIKGSKNDRDLSISVTTFYMKYVGYWLAANYAEKRWSHIAMCYTNFIILFSMWTEIRALFFCWDDLNDRMYVMCNIGTVGLVTVKLLALLVYIEELHDLINYAQKNFWQGNYDSYEQNIVNNCKRTFVFVCTFTFFAQGTAISYPLGPLETDPRSRRISFSFHISVCMCQLLMFTYSCNCLIRDSMDVSNAVYKSAWSLLPMDKYGKMLRGDLILVAMRSQTPCCLTANGFFIVSLETYTNILSTAVSYFTLLRNSTEVT
ncbi:PREDICTED: uncharacterized protein LOC108555664 [Eufriesea mexicana]|uniref:uncharacterized protein LOC108555664 n=1 Tax=Eufriesea mexicana TaxID=516756 RepID=UPI00083C72A7|nr:PREDICTED: uncharacterized protein LOC108555664 [Eufriesea mexicana]